MAADRFRLAKHVMSKGHLRGLSPILFTDGQADVTADVGNDTVSLLSAFQLGQLFLDLIYAHDSSLVLSPSVPRYL
jgi:hypothetical protein